MHLLTSPCLVYPNVNSTTTEQVFVKFHIGKFHFISPIRSSFGYAGSIPDEVIGFFNWPNPYSSIMTLGSTQPLTEMSTRNLPGGKGRPARKAENLTAICEPTV
jgi:hypothetical protein